MAPPRALGHAASAPQPGFAARLLLQAEPRIMYSLALGQPVQSGQISFRGEDNVKFTQDIRFLKTWSESAAKGRSKQIQGWRENLRTKIKSEYEIT